MNPAVDTIALGDEVTWTWSGTLSHGVRSVGSPGFASSTTRAGSGTYALAFAAPGTYHYDCAVHGAAMTGTIVVVGSATEPTTTTTVNDPVGDTFATGGVHWDLTAMTVTRDTGGVTVQLDFTTDVRSPMSLDATAIIGTTSRPTDFVPNDGHLTLGGAALVASTPRAAVALQQPPATRAWWRPR